MQPAWQSPAPTVTWTTKAVPSCAASYQADWPITSGCTGPIRPNPWLANTTAAACAAEPTGVTTGPVAVGTGDGAPEGLAVPVGAGFMALGAQPARSSAKRNTAVRVMYPRTPSSPAGFRRAVSCS